MGAFSRSLAILDELEDSIVTDCAFRREALQAKADLLREYEGFPDDIAEIERAFKGITPC